MANTIDTLKLIARGNFVFTQIRVYNEGGDVVGLVVTFDEAAIVKDGEIITDYYILWLNDKDVKGISLSSCRHGIENLINDFKNYSFGTPAVHYLKGGTHYRNTF